MPHSRVVQSPDTQHSAGPTNLSDLAPPPSVVPFSLFQPCLAVWPSTRYQWPPPRNMCGGGSRESWVCCGVGGCSPAKRVGGSPRTLASRTWTWWPPTSSMNVGWKFWPTVCLCSTDSSWRSTQHLCPRCVETALHALVARTSMGPSSRPLAGGRNAVTPSSLAVMVAHVSSSSQRKRGDRWSQLDRAVLAALGQGEERKVLPGERSVCLDGTVEVSDGRHFGAEVTKT